LGWSYLNKYAREEQLTTHKGTSLNHIKYFHIIIIIIKFIRTRSTRVKKDGKEQKVTIELKPYKQNEK